MRLIRKILTKYNNKSEIMKYDLKKFCICSICRQRVQKSELKLLDIEINVCKECFKKISKS